MTMLGLKEAQVSPAVRALSGDDESRMPRDQVLDRFARATWTGISEPGDRVAGALIAAVGAAPALQMVTDGWSAERILGEGLDPVSATGHVVSIGVAPTGVAPTGVAPTGVAPTGIVPTGVLSLTVDELASGLARWSGRRSPEGALTALQQAVRYGSRLVIPGDECWPTGVDDLGEHAPLALWVRGNLSALGAHGRSIALVGARAATGYGEHVAMEASAGLVDRGYAITSGAAYGIDGMAHRAALASSGTTVAFVAGGVDRFYPSGHDALLTRIVESGAVVSELPPGSSPTKWRFLQRNRLIAASTLATVVLEAGWRSGSLNTAGHAAALGRPLGAVPGPVTSAASAGCHRLIREFDAVCVTTADEMAELAPLVAGDAYDSGGPGRASARSPEETRVLDALSTRAPRTAGDVAARSGLASVQVQAVLGRLELDGTVAERERGWVMRSASA